MHCWLYILSGTHIQHAAIALQCLSASFRAATQARAKFHTENISWNSAMYGHRSCMSVFMHDPLPTVAFVNHSALLSLSVVCAEQPAFTVGHHYIIDYEMAY